MVSTVGQVYPAFVSAFISQASSISVLPFLTFSESSLEHLVTSSTLLCQLSIHQLLRVDFSSEYEYHHLLMQQSDYSNSLELRLTSPGKLVYRKLVFSMVLILQSILILNYLYLFGVVVNSSNFIFILYYYLHQIVDHINF
ncbi:Hypothetical_protein [Hexamita inflata]|uniref:Hypothetical_protein n=1 Tax=Hexamita inflata TaxID=28002 RepID=A0AA86R4U0_9EUKA|nr:Hypothetical protein HINF_LOCUS59196 [Hexamita inflata]